MNPGIGVFDLPSRIVVSRIALFGISASILIIPYGPGVIALLPVIDGPNGALVQFAKSAPPPPPAGSIETSSIFQPV